MDIQLISNIMIFGLICSTFLMLFFLFFSYTKLKHFSVFSSNAFFIFAFISSNIFLLWILLLAISSFDIPSIALTLGIFLIYNAGFYIMNREDVIVSADLVVIQKRFFDKLMLLFFIPIGFLFMGTGAMSIVLQKNFSIAIKGVVFGITIGFLLGFIVYKQMLPKWRSTGFARAKTPEERKILHQFQFNQLPETERLYNRYSFFGSYAFLLIIGIIASFFFGIQTQVNIESFIIISSTAFVPSFLTSFFILAIIADKKIRKTSKEN